MQPPVDSVEGLANQFEDAAVQSRFARAVIGDPETVREKLESLLDETQADELMIVSGIYDHADRLRSYEIVSELAKPSGGAERSESGSLVSREM
jgi:alkanesulfonate monooxygenase SsuD/methylene tetrahydromethanopterin reductase-like flavin-dependent oxidoreductase (luciferase family)